MTLSGYFDNMLNNSEYATAFEIQATCNLLATNITVLLKNGNVYTKHVYQPKTVQTNSRIILLLENQHFQLLKITSNTK